MTFRAKKSSSMEAEGSSSFEDLFLSIKDNPKNLYMKSNKNYEPIHPIQITRVDGQ